MFATNTSTLPITGLAEVSSRPAQFVGLHFFSPVEKMPLVEVIRGEKTSEDAVAHAMDFVKSIRKTPIVGHTTCRSEREDKKLWHQRWRTRERTALASASPDALSAHLPLLENQVSSVWSMGKDGRSYWPVKRQAATADRIANHKGRNPQERAALKQRLLRKWMSK
ncbi:MAG: hypothetical protein CVV18_05565 [Gammaproteobacteria bacterium HGW-Gammaproteobacteria-8]|nr:MAG: hypothetical protein CVV18_05565 [Gammaproteobacteria bacterium HGW-Gammaproteobacteria-8]